MRATPEISGAPGLTGLGTESAGSTGKGKAPTGGPHLSVRGGENKREGRVVDRAKEKEWADWASWETKGGREKFAFLQTQTSFE